MRLWILLAVPLPVAALAAYAGLLRHADLRAFGRALAMADRDAHGQAITDTDWLRIERELQGAYGQLKIAIGGGSF
jgi:hypothetical protein